MLGLVIRLLFTKFSRLSWHGRKRLRRMRHGLQRLGLVEASGLAKCKVRTENVPFYCVYFNDLFKLHCFIELGS
jgi:hypothetical protein